MVRVRICDFLTDHEVRTLPERVVSHLFDCVLQGEDYAYLSTDDLEEIAHGDTERSGKAGEDE